MLFLFKCGLSPQNVPLLQQNIASKMTPVNESVELQMQFNMTVESLNGYNNSAKGNYTVCSKSGLRTAINGL